MTLIIECSLLTPTHLLLVLSFNWRLNSGNFYIKKRTRFLLSSSSVENWVWLVKILVVFLFKLVCKTQRWWEDIWSELCYKFGFFWVLYWEWNIHIVLFQNECFTSLHIFVDLVLNEKGILWSIPMISLVFSSFSALSINKRSNLWNF